MHSVRLLSCAVIVFSLAMSAHAANLRLTFHDPVGDNEGQAPDVIKLVLDFDNQTGAFQINATSTAAHPFAPAAPYKLGIFVNLFNLDVGTTAPNPSLFSSINDLYLSEPTTSLTIVDVNPRLIFWKLGDVVAISGTQLSPDGVGAFYSAARVSGDRGPFLGDDNIATGATATVTAVPEPAGVALVAIVIAGVSTFRRRQLTPHRERLTNR